MRQGVVQHTPSKPPYPTVASLEAGEWFIIRGASSNAMMYMKLAEPACEVDDDKEFHAMSWCGDLRLSDTTQTVIPVTFKGVDDKGNLTYTMDGGSDA